MHHTDRTAEFTFGPRHRQVLSTHRFPWIGAGLALAVFIAGIVFLLLACVGTAHADTLDQRTTRAEALNDVCRDGPGVTPACAKRDAAFQALHAEGVCYNPHSASHADAWVSCGHRVSVDCTKAMWAARFVAQMRDGGSPAPLIIQTVRRDSPDAFGPALDRTVWAIVAGPGRFLPPIDAGNQVQYECLRAEGKL